MQKYDCFEDVQKIEQKIFTLVRKYNKGLTQNEKIELHELFSDRKRLLNKSCRYTEENVSALKEINRELENLTLLNRRRALDLVRFISDIGICSESADWMIKAYLIVDGDMGGIELSDEKSYGSNFNVRWVSEKWTSRNNLGENYVLGGIHYETSTSTVHCRVQKERCQSCC